MPKLTILSGVSGSGKSTWARAQFGAVVVSRDDLRLSLFGSDGPDYYKVDKAVLRAREDFVTKVEHHAIKHALMSGQDVISDNTHTMMRYINGIAAIGWALGAEVERKVFTVSLETAKSQNRSRAIAGGRNVPNDAIERQFEQLEKCKNTPLRPPPKTTPYAGTPGKPNAILVDIDGTLAHMRDHRKPFDWKDVGKDEPDLNVIQVINWIKTGMAYDYEFSLNPIDDARVIVMSGRDESCRDETARWLGQHGVPYDALHMRPEGDMRKDSIVKAELFDKYVRDNFNVVMVFDDRNQVVDMWRGMGVQVAQVAEGDF